MLLMPPDKADPKNKAMIDALMDVAERDRTRRGWSFWLTVAAASLVALWGVRYDFLPGSLRLALAVLGGVGLLLVLVFLSTKAIGRGFYAGPDWWL